MLRTVVRNGFGRDLAELLARDLRNAVKCLDNIGGLPPHEQRSAFHHRPEGSY